MKVSNKLSNFTAESLQGAKLIIKVIIHYKLLHIFMLRNYNKNVKSGNSQKCTSVKSRPPVPFPTLPYRT